MNAKIKTFFKYATILLPDKMVIRWKYKALNGHFLDLDNPQTYNEKLHWLNLNNHDPQLTTLVDKLRVRPFVSKRIGEEHLVPLVGHWDTVEEIPFSTLPDQYVLKCNHDSGSVVICRDKSTFDVEAAKTKLKRCLKRNYYYHSREWAYKNVKPCIVCEELIATSDGKAPKDYKIFCCDGVPQMFFVASDRGENTKFDFYNMDGSRIPVTQHYPNSGKPFDPPKKFEEMVKCAEKLSAGFPQVRVDFYEDMDGNVLFGEMTFIHFSGMHDFKPDEYNLKFGSIINLNSVNIIRGGCTE